MVNYKRFVIVEIFDRSEWIFYVGIDKINIINLLEKRDSGSYFLI